MSRISRNANVIFRAERLIAQRRMAVLRRQTGMMAAAGIAGGVGLIMLNVAAFFALSEVLSQALSALIVAAVNLGLAAAVASAAGKVNADEEIARVAEVRDIAVEDLEVELQDAAAEVRVLSQAVRKMAHDPFGAMAPGVMGALASAVIKNLRK